MQEKSHLKSQGIRFARSLQTLVKMVNMFSAEHKSAAGLLQRTYDLLNPLLKQSRSLTIGFVEQRVLLNNILTAEESLKPLENEFLKRGIGAVTFDAGITLAAFRNAVAAISSNPKIIAEGGGLLPFLEQKQLEFVRIFPASKTEARNDDGDTVLEIGSEEFLISKALNGMNGGLTRGIDAMLTHMESTVASAGGGDGSGASGSAPGFGGGTGNGVEGVPGGMGSGNGFGSGSGFGQGTNPVFTGGGAGGQRAHSGYLTEMQRMVEQKFEASLTNPSEDPQKAYLELARMLQTVRPDAVLNNIMADSGQGPAAQQQEMTAEVFEDSALRWAMKRLSVIPAGDEAVIVEEQVFRVLMRSLQATHSATRLARKLAEFAKDYALPPQTLARIQAEVRWLTLTPQQRLCELLAITHFTPAEFRRCLDLIRDFLRLGEPEQAMALGLQYFSIFDRPVELEIQDVSRVPELLRSLAGTQGEFWEAAADWLTNALLTGKLNPLLHFQVVNALATLARIAATYETFELVQKTGSALEKAITADPAAHEKCCSAAIAALLPPSAVDRITEMFFEKKNDPAWLKLVTSVLRWAGSDALERMFIALDNEITAANRLALLRLIARLGPVALAPARKRLQRSEWYVVRNACKLLGELKDPDLLKELRQVFVQRDERVQKAALQAIIENRPPGTAAVLAEVLPQLAPSLLEDVFLELIFQADPECLPSLERCFSSPLPAAVLWRLVSVVAALHTHAAEQLLVKIARDESLPQNVRAAASKIISERSGVKGGNSKGNSSSDPGVVTQGLGYAGA